MLVKTNVRGLQKDKTTGAVINSNYDEYKKVVAARSRLKDNAILRAEVDILKKQVKQLMDKLGIE